MRSPAASCSPSGEELAVALRAGCDAATAALTGMDSYCFPRPALEEIDLR